MKTNYQRQDSLTDQMATVMALAVAAGCYDAHDWLKSRWDHPAGKQAATALVDPSTVVQSRCSVQGRTGQCTKMRGHGQRHRYESDTNRYIAPHVPPPRAWTKVETVPIKGTGSRSYRLAVGNPCKVSDVRGMFTVVSIESHPDGRVNVEVKGDRTGHTRVFPLGRIGYKRPRKSGT